MATIIVGFSRPKAWFSPFSWIIRLFDWTPYSHTYVRFYSAEAQSQMVYQASSLMVNYVSTEIFDSAEDVCAEFPLTVSDDTFASVLQFAASNAGQPYNLKSVLGVAIAKMLRLKKNPITGTGFFCSLLIGDILVEKLGDKIDGDPNLWTPKTIYQYLSAA